MAGVQEPMRLGPACGLVNPGPRTHSNTPAQPHARSPARADARTRAHPPLVRTTSARYSTGPKIKPGDLQIDQLVRRYTSNPVMVIIDVKPKDLGIPTEAYHAVEEIREGQQQSWTFKHVPSSIGALESEEVGVEHLLRDVRDTTISTLANQVAQKLGALKGLAARLSEVDGYLQNVLSGRLPVNHKIIYALQDIFNLLPNLNVEELVQAFAVKTNDMMLAIYLASVIRAVVALHNLIDNRIVNKEKERASDEVAANKDKEGAAKKEEGKENKEQGKGATQK